MGDIYDVVQVKLWEKVASGISTAGGLRTESQAMGTGIHWEGMKVFTVVALAKKWAPRNIMHFI